MRARLAKSLRRIARDHTTGLPDRTYEVTKDGQIRLATGCTRAAYRQLKKQLRRSR